jgi:hypothetical protein
MLITIGFRRPARRWIALLVGLLLLIVPGVALAAGQLFTDVPPSHPFYNDINGIARAGITAGFNDGTYGPAQPVTRQAMAAFLQRGFGRVGMVIGGEVLDGPSVAAGQVNGSFAVVKQLTITVPGANSAFSPQQMVHLRGHVEFYAGMNSGQGCPCEFSARISDVTGATVSSPQYQTFQSASPFSHPYSFDTEAVFVAPPGPRLYRLEVALVNRETTPSSTFFDLISQSSLSAATFPYGPSGANTLTAPGE